MSEATANNEGHGAISVAELASRYDEIVAALTSTVEDPAARNAAQRLGKSREDFMDACNRLLEGLVELKQHVASQPYPSQQQQQQRQRSKPTSAQTDSMDVDGDSQQLAAAIRQQHDAFLEGL